MVSAVADEMVMKRPAGPTAEPPAAVSVSGYAMSGAGSRSTQTEASQPATVSTGNSENSLV